MPEGYLHLTCEQRCQIYALLQSGHSQAHIARQIGVDPSTISRELVRNTGARGYRFKQAHEKASQRRQEASDKPRKMTPDLVELIEEKLTQEQWSGDAHSPSARICRARRVAPLLVSPPAFAPSGCEAPPPTSSPSTRAADDRCKSTDRRRRRHPQSACRTTHRSPTVDANLGTNAPSATSPRPAPARRAQARPPPPAFGSRAGPRLRRPIVRDHRRRLIPLTQVRLYIVAMPAFQNRRAALAAARADEAVRPAPFE